MARRKIAPDPRIEAAPCRHVGCLVDGCRIDSNFRKYEGAIGGVPIAALPAQSEYLGQW